MFAELKLASYAAAAAGLAYFGIPQEAYCLMAVLIILDTITGSIRAIRIDARSFTSAALRNGALAKLLLLLIPVVVSIVAKIAPEQMREIAMGAVNGSIGILALSEAYSTMANIGAIIGKDGGPESDGVSILISKILEVLKSVMDSFFSAFLKK